MVEPGTFIFEWCCQRCGPRPPHGPAAGPNPVGSHPVSRGGRAPFDRGDPLRAVRPKFLSASADHRRPRARRKSRPRIRPRGPPPPEAGDRNRAAAPRTAEGGTTPGTEPPPDRAATRPQRRRPTEPPDRAAGDPAATRCPRPPPAGKLAHSSSLGQTLPAAHDNAPQSRIYLWASWIISSCVRGLFG
jgi:hypothetical protein